MKKADKLKHLQQALEDEYGYRLWKNDSGRRGRLVGDWKTGYTISCHTLIHFRSLAEVERWLKPPARKGD